MSDSNVCYLTDISEYEADTECGMKLWWKKCESKHGVVRKDTVLPTRILHQTYDDMRAISQMETLTADAIEETIEPIIERVKDADVKKDKQLLELTYRRLGWFAAFALYIEPQIRLRYEDVEIDSWTWLERKNLFVSVDVGRLLRDRTTRELVYHCYVPSVSVSRKWFERWDREPRLQLEMAAIREQLKQEPHSARVRALSCGFRGVQDRLIHPYVYGKYSIKDKVWSAKSWANLDKGYQELPVWEYNGSIVDWVVECGKEMAEQQFPLSDPIPVNYALLANFLAQRLHREREINMHKEECQRNTWIRNIHFVKNPKSCETLIGNDRCQYFDLCWGKGRSEDPLKRGYVSTVLPVANQTPATEVAEVRV